MRKKISTTCIAGALCAVLSGPALAAEQPFSAMEGLNAQPLSALEMDAIHGAVTLEQIQGTYVRVLDRLLDRGRINQRRYDRMLARFNTVILPYLARRYGLGPL